MSSGNIYKFSIALFPAMRTALTSFHFSKLVNTTLSFLLTVAFCICSLALVVYSQPVQAQYRIFPPDSKPGKMELPPGKIAATINSTLYRYAIAVQFRDHSNIILFPEDFRRYVGTAPIRYTLDIDGDLKNVWFLTRYEASLPENKVIDPDPEPEIMPEVLKPETGGNGSSGDKETPKPGGSTDSKDSESNTPTPE